jgi:PKD repeat protein
MKITAFLCSILLALGMAWTAKAEVVLEDDFNDDVLHPAWLVSFENATGWDFQEMGTNLEVYDIYTTIDGGWAKTVVERQFAPVTDFHAHFDISWDLSDTQQFNVRFFDSNMNQVAQAGFHDNWVGLGGGRIHAVIGDDLGPFVKGADPSNGTSDSASFDIVRLGDFIEIFWNGNSFYSANYPSDPISTVQLDFWYYRSTADGTTFGTESIDLLRVEGTHPPPVADLSASPTTGTAPLTVSFTDNSSGTITAWSWDFDDDGIQDSAVQNPSYTYNIAGTYSVSLTVTGPGGVDTETRTDYISVTPPPPAPNFSASPTTGTAPLTVSFTDESTGTVDSWDWDFGDGFGSTQQNPTHKSTTPGVYTVSLMVTGASVTDTETKPDYITVKVISGSGSGSGGR